MDTSEMYNGWINRETWVANLWLTSSIEEFYRHCVTLSENIADDNELADALRDYTSLIFEYRNVQYWPGAPRSIVERITHNGQMFLGDLLGNDDDNAIVSDSTLNRAMGKIDWHAIADSVRGK